MVLGERMVSSGFGWLKQLDFFFRIVYSSGHCQNDGRRGNSEEWMERQNWHERKR